MALQASLDPAALLGSREIVRHEVDRVLDGLPEGRAHVFYLGHGALPATEPERVRDLAKHVHASGRKRRSR